MEVKLEEMRTGQGTGNLEWQANAAKEEWMKYDFDLDLVAKELAEAIQQEKSWMRKVQLQTHSLQSFGQSDQEIQHRVEVPN